jgi:hypothetical protein
MIVDLSAGQEDGEPLPWEDRAEEDDDEGEEVRRS